MSSLLSLLPAWNKGMCLFSPHPGSKTQGSNQPVNGEAISLRLFLEVACSCSTRTIPIPWSSPGITTVQNTSIPWLPLPETNRKRDRQRQRRQRQRDRELMLGKNMPCILVHPRKNNRSVPSRKYHRQSQGQEVLEAGLQDYILSGISTDN